MGFFFPKLKIYEFKIYSHDNEEWCKNWRGIVSSKLTGIWRMFIRALKNLKNVDFTGLPLTKVYNVWAKKVLRSCVWWNWQLIQNLKENWFVLSKMTWRIWETFIRALESFEMETLMGFFYPKLENVWDKNLQGSYLLWQWKKMQNLKRNSLVVSKLAWGLCWVLTRALRNLKNVHFNALPLTKVYNVWAK